MLIPNRHGSSNSYRYGFQGQEKDDEIKGEGNSINYTFRMHDPRVGRFFAVDPLAPKYPFYSHYQFSGNRVLDAIELEGLEPVITVTGKQTGYTIMHVYGYTQNSKAVIVKTYEATIHYREPDGTMTYLGTFNVTRDGWTSMGTDANNNLVLINRSTEPRKGDSSISTEVGLEYSQKYGKGAPAMQLPDIHANEIPESNNKIYFNGEIYDTATSEEVDFVRDNPGVAKSVQFHVGGIYEKIDGSISLGGAYGCFGIIAPEQVYKTIQEAKLKSKEAVKVNNGEVQKNEVSSTSNSEMKRFSDTANKKRKKNEKIEVEINKRQYNTKGKIKE